MTTADDMRRIELRLRHLIALENMVQPDAVEHRLDDEELVFLWNDRRLAVIVECSGGQMADVRETAHG